MESRSSRPPSSRRAPARAEGSYSVCRLNDAVSETSFTGYLTADLFAACDRDYWRVAGDRAIPYAVLDGSAVTGYEPGIHAAARPAMGLFKERGGREYLIVASSGVVRMLGSSLAASSQVPFRLFDTRDDAFEYLKTIGMW
jgi:hypothetical protein